jgi:flagellin-like hook-associated protein FlgL
VANLINPISTTAGFVMKSSAKQLSQSGGQIATGLRGPSNIVDYVIGSKLRDNTAILRSVAKAAAYGTNMLKTAESTLISVKGKLTNLKKIIAQANTAHGESLERLNLLYKDGVKDILRLLESAEFNNRKLFDGTFAGPGANEPAQDMPEAPVVVGPLVIRVGENINNTVSIIIPRLLGGKGNVQDQRVDGRFTLLFPITPAVAAAVADVEPPRPVGLNWNQLLALNPHGDPIRTIIYDVAKRAGIAAGGNPAGGAAAGMIVRAGYLAARSEAKLIAGGNLLNAHEQLEANQIIDTALTIVTNQIASIGGQMRDIKQAIGDMDISIKVQNEAGDSYLNTNYEEATKKFKNALLAMRGGISIVSQGYLIPEAALELITE